MKHFSSIYSNGNYSSVSVTLLSFLVLSRLNSSLSPQTIVSQWSKYPTNYYFVYSTYLSILFSTFVHPDCSAGWVDFGEFCYKVEVTSKQNWMNARTDCLINGGDLASIHTAEEQKFVSNQVQWLGQPGDNFWIGLNDRTHDTSFQWSDSTSVIYRKWANGQPSDSGIGGEDCAEMRYGRSAWNDENCENWYHYICKRHKGKNIHMVSVQTTTEAILGDPGADRGAGVKHDASISISHVWTGTTQAQA